MLSAFIMSVISICDCNSNELCSLVPPSTVSALYPCYQGSPADATKCYQTDPLLQEGTTWNCGNCTDFGFPNYKENDPIYKTMELWFVGIADENKN